MKRHQNNIFRMWLNVDRFLTDNNAIWNTLPLIANTVTSFRSNLSLLAAKADNQLAGTKGVTRSKKTIRIDLTDCNMLMSANTKAWADDNKNPQISGEMTIPRSRFDRMSEPRLITASNDIHIKAADISLLPNAADYNITPTTLTTHQTLINEFIEKVTKLAQISSVRKAATTSIPNIIKQDQKLLEENLDRQMYNFKKANPDFFEAYQNIRQIIDYGENFSKPDTPPPAPPQ
jgi:hypothetical protein